MVAILRLEPRHQRLSARLLLLQILEIGLGEGGVEGGERLALLHDVAGMGKDPGDDGAVERLDEQRALGGQDASAAAHYPVELDHRHEDQRQDDHSGQHVQDGVLAVRRGRLDDRLGFGLERAYGRVEPISPLAARQ